MNRLVKLLSRVLKKSFLKEAHELQRLSEESKILCGTWTWRRFIFRLVLETSSSVPLDVEPDGSFMIHTYIKTYSQS